LPADRVEFGSFSGIKRFRQTHQSPRHCPCISRYFCSLCFDVLYYSSSYTILVLYCTLCRAGKN